VVVVLLIDLLSVRKRVIIRIMADVSITTTTDLHLGII